jgi:hypothetical protein
MFLKIPFYLKWKLFVFMLSFLQFHNQLVCFRCRYFAVLCVIKAMNEAPLDAYSGAYKSYFKLISG